MARSLTTLTDRCSGSNSSSNDLLTDCAVTLPLVTTDSTTATTAKDASTTTSTTPSPSVTRGYRNNPYRIAPLRIDTSSTAKNDDDDTTLLHAQITAVVRELCPFLLLTASTTTDASSSPSSPSVLSIRPLTGGLSNHLFLVSSSSSRRGIDTTTNPSSNTTTNDEEEDHSNDDDSDDDINNNNSNYGQYPSTVLVRIHPESGGGSDRPPDHHREQLPSSNNDFSIVNREVENRFAAWLATQTNGNDDNSLAPTVFGRFENGRIEEFYEHVRPLSCSEMKGYARYIAPQMASFHQLPDPSPQILPKPMTTTATSETSCGCCCCWTVYESIEAWLQQADDDLLRQRRQSDSPTTDIEEEEQQQQQQQQRTLLDRLRKEWKWLQGQLATAPKTDSIIAQHAYRFIRRVAITHMDCQPLNILIHDDDQQYNDHDNRIDTPQLRLIDFEYAGWNPVAADIANTFCEYCEMSNLQAKYEAEYPSAAQQDDFFWHYCQAYPSKTEEDDDAMCLPQHRNSDDWKEFSKALQYEVGRFSLLSHLGWSIWSVVKSNETDGVDFDYLFYAKHRMEGYDWAKTKFFGQFKQQF